MAGHVEFRYVGELVNEALARLAARPRPREGGTTFEIADYQAALVDFYDSQRRAITREDRSGERKWREWTAPPLDFDDCLEFPALVVGEDISVTISTKGTHRQLLGLIGPGTCARPAPNRPSHPASPDVRYAISPRGDDQADPVVVTIGDEGFERGTFHSYDGRDYFALRMTWTSGTTVLIEDTNLYR